MDVLKSTVRRLTSRAALIRQSSAALLRYDTSPSLLRKTSATNLFPELDDISASPGIELFYYSGWPQPRIHYTTEPDGEWTNPPGSLMTLVPAEEKQKANLPSVDNKPLDQETIWKIVIPGISGLEFVPNNGSGQWDKSQSGQNYKIHEPGRFVLIRGTVRQVLDPPGKPALLKATEVCATSVSLHWNPPMVNSALVVGYHVYCDGTHIHTTGEKTLSYKDTGLLGLTKHIYHVVAFNDNGIEGLPSDNVKVVTSEPGKPSSPENVFVTSHSTKCIELKWSAPADNGGSLISAYVVYRNGNPIATVKASTGFDEVYRDTYKLIPGASYIYHISAMNHSESDEVMHPSNLLDLPSPAPNGVSSDEGSTCPIAAKGVVRNYAAIAIKQQKSYEGSLSRGIEAQAIAMKVLPRLNDGRSHIILQGFNWNSCKNAKGWYNVLSTKIPQIKSACIDMVWLPPPAQSVSPDGYMPTKWYTLSSKYGEAEALKQLNSALGDQGITPMLDLVVNHRCGTKQDDKGQWTLFEDPEWGPWAIVENNYQGYTGGVGSRDTGAQSECAPDIDHNNKKVREDIVTWIKWLFKEVGFGAVRLDMAPGYSVGYQVQYIEALDSPFAVGEYWNGDPNVLHNYTRGGRGRLSAFDFALYYCLRRCVETNNYEELCVNGSLQGLVGRDPEKAVTFIDNHDTEHLGFVGLFGRGNGDLVLRGYAFLLTHPGTPCIYWNHFADFGDFMRQKIEALAKIREANKINSVSGVYIDRSHWGLYAAYISSDRHCHRGGGSVAVKIGSNDWHPDGPNWQRKVEGNGFAVWVKAAHG